MAVKKVSDFHEAVWLVANGCRIEGIEIIALTYHEVWRMSISGYGLSELTAAYQSGEARLTIDECVNAQTVVLQTIEKAKKKYFLASTVNDCVSPVARGTQCSIKA